LDQLEAGVARRQDDLGCQRQQPLVAAQPITLSKAL
jgi:hypothetical protein